MQRPTSVTVFGILNIVFAALGIFGTIAAIVLFLAPPDPNNPILKSMYENPAYAIWFKVEIPLGILSSAASLASGIGLLYLKSWARTLSMAYAIYAILLGILGTAVNFMLYRPIVEKLQGPAAAGAIGGMIGGSIGGCLSLAYPVLLLIFMSRPTVTAAFHPPPPPPT
ncbi:MAG: hypothetical protein ACLPT4_11725 [Verrucomicrobiia bacterium]